MQHIAIITPFNDIKTFEGGSRSSIKERIDYFDQFLILYDSIMENWSGADFTFSFVIVHSIAFNKKRLRILNKLPEVKLELVNYASHKTKIRPMAYDIDVACDYRLILDVDMYALHPPRFDFNVDAQAMYGGNKYNSDQWAEICEFIGAKVPQEDNLKKDKGSVTSWQFDDHANYHLGILKDKIFPYFNNGAILIKNSLAKQLGSTWDNYKLGYINYLNEIEGVNHQVGAGQNVIGVAISNVASSWKPFEPGFNIIIQDGFDIGKQLIEEFPLEQVQLFHYINVPKGSTYENLVQAKYDEIRSKYYKKWNVFL